MNKTRIFLISRLIFVFIVFTAGAAYFLFRAASKEPDIYGKTNTEKKLACSNCNVVIISLTNVRKDHIGLYGYGRQTTPNIDEFFKNSLIFNNAFAPTSWTLPNAVSFFSSLFPYSHGVMERVGGQSLDEKIMTLPIVLGENGYNTAAFTGDGDYNRQYGLSKGFKLYSDAQSYRGEPLPLGRGALSYLPIRDYLSRAVNWLDNNAQNKFLFLIQGYDAHCPFTPQAPFDKKFTGGLASGLDYSSCLWTFDKTEPVYKNGKKYWPVKTSAGNDGAVDDVLMSDEDIEYMKALYDGAISEADFYLSPLFEEFKKLDLEKNTIFIFMAEHGDLFGEHGRFMRGGPLRGTFYDSVINFPIVIKHPAIKEAIVINDLVQTVDFMPTLLDMLGINDPQYNIRQGKALSFSSFGDAETNQYAYSASRFSPSRDNLFFNGTSVTESIRNKDWKLIKESISGSRIFEEKYGQEDIGFNELYNIREDPRELNNLYGARPDIVSDLEKRLSSWRDSLKKPDQLP